MQQVGVVAVIIFAGLSSGLSTLVLAASSGGGPLVDVFRYIQTGGVVAVLLVLIWAILTKRLVPGWTYVQLGDDCNRRVAEAGEREREWRDIALHGTGLLERQQSVVERAAETIARSRGAPQ